MINKYMAGMRRALDYMHRVRLSGNDRPANGNDNPLDPFDVYNAESMRELRKLRRETGGIKV